MVSQQNGRRAIFSAPRDVRAHDRTGWRECRRVSFFAPTPARVALHTKNKQAAQRTAMSIVEQLMAEAVCAQKSDRFE